MYISVLMSGRLSVAMLLATEKDRQRRSGAGVVVGLSSSLARRLGDGDRDESGSGLALGVSFVRVLVKSLYVTILSFIVRKRILYLYALL